MKDVDGQTSLFAQDGSAGRTSQGHSRAGRRNTRTSGSYWKKSLELKAIPFMSLDLTPGHGNLLGEFYWELISPWLGESSMLNTGPAPLNAVDVYSLSQILEGSPHRRYYLSRTACLGILRRASERGKELPPQLKTALMMQAGLLPAGQRLGEMKAYHINQRDEGIDLHGVSGALMATSNMQMQTFITGEPVAFAANQRDEVRDLHGVAGAIQAQPGMKQQTFVAGFCAGAAPTAGGIGYQEEISPTLKAAESGTNMVPSVLCLNDQGGSVMECTEDVTGTLRAQEHGHQPLVFENHGIDARYTGPHKVAPTMSARYGTGGNNVPLVEQEPVYCITSNAIDRQPLNGGNGIGYQENIAYTLTATDHHAVFSRQRVDVFRDDDVASTESARQHKDATDLVCQLTYQDTVGALTTSDRKGPNSQYVSQDKCIVEGPFLIRRLTPLECERLQGFPDGWTDIPGASDSARYKALGNSVAIPCVEYIMRGIVMAAGPAA